MEKLTIKLPEKHFSQKLLNAIWTHQAEFRDKPEAIILNPHSFLVWKIESEQNCYPVYSNNGEYKWGFQGIRILVAETWKDITLCHKPENSAMLEYRRELQETEQPK